MTINDQQRERYDEHIKRVELEEKLANEIKNRDFLIERQVKLREKNRMQVNKTFKFLI